MILPVPVEELCRPHNSKSALRSLGNMSTEQVASFGGTSIRMPLDLIRLSIDQRVYVKLKGERELRGKLYAYDQHLNMVLGDVEETHTSIEVDEETLEESITPIKRTMEVLFVRGDGVLLVAPPVRV